MPGPRRRPKSPGEESPGAAVGRRVRELRLARGWTQATLAQMAGLSRSYVPKLEAGYAPNPTWETIQRLASVLGVPPEQLLGRSHDAPLRPADLRAVARQLRQMAETLLETARRLETAEVFPRDYLERLLRDVETALAACGDRPLQARDLLEILKAELRDAGWMGAR